jgi:alkylated DNA repair dioxygenase AlkB
VEPFDYRPGFIAATEASRLLAELWQGLAWEQYQIRIFGKKISQPRLTAWCSDPGISYAYSGIRLPPVPWHSALGALRNRLAVELEYEFNSVLVNAYRDGNDAMGWHADDEPELGPKPVIASVSLGATRKMLIRPKSGGPSRALQLESGSLLVMAGESQARWVHSVPRTRRGAGLRINLTYRKILGKS